MLKNGIIYMIFHKELPIIYIGSTFNLKRRWTNHMACYNRYLNGHYLSVAIYSYFKKHGIENFQIEEIKRYPVCDRKHLYVYETLWINKLKTVNNYNPFGFPLLKHYKRRYFSQNREMFKEASKKSYHKNSKQISLKRKEKTECACGTEYRRVDMARHIKSRKHLQFLIDGIVIPYKISSNEGHRGLHFDIDIQKWRIAIRINGKKTRFGTFDSFHEGYAKLRELRKLYPLDTSKNSINSTV